MIGEDTYSDNVKLFRNIEAQEAIDMFENKDKVILYIGRETCPYCRKFVKKLASVAERIGEAVYYVNSNNPGDTEINSLRQKYTVNTVPGFIVKNSGNIKVKCDSSMPEEQIMDMIN